MIPIDIHSILEHAGLGLADYAFGQGVKPCSFEMREYRVDTSDLAMTSPEAQKTIWALGELCWLTLQGRSLFIGMPTHIWNQGPLTTVLDVTLENGKFWDGIEVDDGGVYTKSFTSSKIAEIKVWLTAGQLKVPLRVKNSIKGSLTDTESQRLWGNFRNARDPRNPAEDRYGSDSSLQDVLKKLWNS